MDNKSHFTDLRSVLKRYLYHWPLFLLGLILAAAGAYTYLQTANRVYEVSATILVKDEKKSPEEKSMVPELDQSASPKNAEAEIEILRSKNLINQVVNRFQLWTTYKTKRGLKTLDLYESTPVKFEMVQKAGMLTAHSLEVLIKDKNSFEIENLSGQKQTVAFNTPYKSEFGSWKLKPTDFIDQYIGSTITIEVDDEQAVTNNYVKSLDAHLLDKTAPTIGLFVSDEVPQRGRDFLNGLITAYNDAAMAEQKRKTKSTIDFIDNRLSSLSGELSHAEKSVQGYRSSQGLTDISTQAKTYLENTQSNDSKLNDVNVQLNIINGIEQYVNSSSDNPPSTMGISDPTLVNLVSKLSELQLKRSALLATTPESNPMFNPINKQITLTKQSIKDAISGVKSSLLNSKRELQSVNNRTQSSIRDLPVQERQFVDMKRQQSIKENLYVYLLQKREELALSYASTFTDARIVDNATVGDVKWPRPALISAIALLCGIGLPFLLIFFRDSFNDKVTSRRDIERAVDVPIAGEVSYDTSDNKVIVVNNKHSLLGEQFRTIRTNLYYLHQNRKLSPSAIKLNLHNGSLESSSLHDGNDNHARVTLFTSSIAKEGKSFVSTNTAVALAALRRKTVILEMDLRKPKILKNFDLSADHIGITDYLTHKANLDSIIRPSGIPYLDIIGSGEISSEPSELLESNKLAELIAELRERYDDVIIDSPPLHLVTDAMIISKLTDINLYVIRQGYTGKEELTFIKEVNDSEKIANLNLVFNGIRTNKYGYGYRYDNSYYSEPQKATFTGSFKRFMSRF
ncbi:polysaccharide biosynthesis tyrosine autokinase [Mucilaginibacter sp. PAMB04274]|uniref:GumC family protein n=1 Tax=Mucilaginibacter sp. PAMB04274 TaxID=3138568 RepID=UPI0031F6113F